MLKMSDVVQMRLFKKYQMDIDSPHILSFLHPFSSVGKKRRSCLWCLYFHIFFCFSFELMCSHFGLSKETCVEPFSGSPASTISLTFDNIPFPSSVFYPPPHPFQISPFSLSIPSLPQQPNQAANARKRHFHFLHCARVCSSLFALT